MTSADVTRRRGLPAPVTVTDEYLAALLVETTALRAAIERLAGPAGASRPDATNERLIQREPGTRPRRATKGTGHAGDV